ncbi:MAG: FHA domain-containing protein [Gemmatales bacterium]|nr:FHA domain-containing protein [Gemmatales bacterium]MDW8387207.1 FHA domain-containing protein [Gemmatales bacterium]
MHVGLVIVKGGPKGRMIALRDGETLVGRAKGCKLRLMASDVSRRHCLLTLTGDRLRVEDLGSVNGFVVNGVRRRDAAWLMPGDRLRIGPVEFLFVYDPDSHPPHPVSPESLDVTIPAPAVFSPQPQDLPWAEPLDSPTPPQLPALSEDLPLAEPED